MALSQTRETPLKTVTLFTHGTDEAQLSDTFIMRGQHKALILIDCFPVETTAPDVPIQFQIQAANAGGEDWAVIADAVRTVAGASSLAAVASTTAVEETEIPVKADPTGWAIPGASIALRDAATGGFQTRTVMAAATGADHSVTVLDKTDVALAEDDLVLQTHQFEIPVDVGLYPKLRVVALGNNGAAGPNFYWRARIRGCFEA